MHCRSGKRGLQFSHLGQDTLVNKPKSAYFRTHHAFYRTERDTVDGVDTLGAPSRSVIRDDTIALRIVSAVTFAFAPTSETQKLALQTPRSDVHNPFVTWCRLPWAQRQTSHRGWI